MALQVEQAVRLYRRLICVYQFSPQQAKNYVLGMMGLSFKQSLDMRKRLGMVDENTDICTDSE